MNEAMRTSGPARPAKSAPVTATRAGRRRTAWLWALFGIGSVLAVYLVGRGVAELILINYGDPASYAKDWGGPSLAGVLAVHSGPGLAIVAAGTWWWLRGRRTRT
jgi:hypothetical protein